MIILPKLCQQAQITAMPTINTKAFRTITASTLATTALIEGFKKYIKKQKDKAAKANSKGQLAEKDTNPINGSNTKPRSSGVRTPSSARITTETEETVDRLSTLELYAWLPTAMTAFEEIALNKWITAIDRPSDITIPFFKSLVLIRDKLRCRNPHELASALISIVACFVDGEIPWDTYIELDSRRYVKLEELFWGSRGIGRPEKFWADAYRANKALPQINPAELAILTAMESQGYDKPGEKRKIRDAEEAVMDQARGRVMRWQYKSGREDNDIDDSS